MLCAAGTQSVNALNLAVTSWLWACSGRNGERQAKESIRSVQDVTALQASQYKTERTSVRTHVLLSTLSSSTGKRTIHGQARAWQDCNAQLSRQSPNRYIALN